jgi:ubiquinone biosynthesis protein
MSSTPRTALWRVARTLARHGILGALRGESHLPSPVQLREAFEDLGVVYLKFGQVLALRRDLLPPEYISELERLHDNLAPVPFDAVREIVERETGQPIEMAFSLFREEPMGAATIAQVHHAVLHDGREVIVKVRRPDVEARAALDIPTLIYVAAWAERVQPSLRTFDLVGMVREFGDALTREMDLRLEARTIERFHRALAGETQLWIPRPIADLTTRDVLVEEFSPGKRLDEYAAEHPGKAPALARTIAMLAMRQVFETGLFHADPHPGNLFVLRDGRLCLHDFGMIGEIDEKLRTALGDMLAAVVRGNPMAAAESYVEMGVAGEGVDLNALAADLSPIIRRIRERPLEEVSIGETIEVVLKVGARHKLKNPGSLLLLTRGFLITEALLKRLDPNLNVMGLLTEELPRISAARFTTARVSQEAVSLLRELMRLTASGPADVRKTLARIARGDLGRVRMPDLEPIAIRITADVERLTGGVTAAALLISGSLLGTTSGWHRVLGDILLAVGIVSTFTVAIGALRKRRAHR